MRRRAAIITGVGVFLVLAWLLLGSTFSYSSICSHCGARESGTRRFLPGTTTCYSHSTSVHPTPVSRVLESTGIVSPHQHDWQLSQGGGNGILCAIGEGRHLRGSVESENVAAIIAAAHRFGDITFRNKVVKTLLDPKTSRSVFYLGNRVETDSFTSAESYRTWVAEMSEFFLEELAMLQAE